MTKKITVLIVLCSLILLPLSVCRSNPTLPANAGSQIERALNLTDTQKAQLKPLLSSVHQEVSGIVNDQSLSQAQKCVRLATLRAQTHAAINKILTPEQQQQLQYLRKQAHLSTHAQFSQSNAH